MLWGRSSNTKRSSMYTGYQTNDYSSGHIRYWRTDDLLLSIEAGEGTSNTVLEGDNKDAGKEGDEEFEPYEFDDKASKNTLDPDLPFRAYEPLPYMKNIDLSTKSGLEFSRLPYRTPGCEVWFVMYEFLKLE
ncbi:hypothetical protein PVK06_019904 [Gossypium arboreum]|uniref:Uncharacterized protein n=1 Tax=Gossypium arboreum TaxID=29729 RepID=A0ABR0PLB7_GOSAR|nr:hypothetical protein PVK06_019904 [Gossypium arboreum]